MSEDTVIQLIFTKVSTGSESTQWLRHEAEAEDLIQALQQAPTEHACIILCDVLGWRHEQEAVPTLINMLEHDSVKIRSAAADSLAKIGDPISGSALLHRLKLPEPNLKVQGMLLAALGAVHCRAAIPLLTTYLDSPEPGQRGSAAWSLGHLQARESLPQLEAALLNERIGYPRERITEAIAKIKAFIKKVASLPPRHDLVIPETWDLSYHEFRQIDPQKLSPDDLDWLLLKQDLLQIKHKATGILLDVGWYPDSSPSGFYRLVLIQDYEWEQPLFSYASSSYQEIIAKIEEVAVDKKLAVILKEEESKKQLKKLGVLALTTQLSTASDARVRYEIVDQLKRMADPLAGEALHHRFLLPEPDLNTRRLLLRALGAVGYAPAIPTLISWLQNPDSKQREAAAWSLGKLNAKQAIAPLESALKTERNRLAREEMQTAIADITRNS